MYKNTQNFFFSKQTEHKMSISALLWFLSKSFSPALYRLTVFKFFSPIRLYGDKEEQ